MTPVKPDNASDQPPTATSITTPPRNTYHDVAIPAGDGMIVYYAEANAFVALYPEEYRACFAEAEWNSKKIQALQDANRRVTEAAIDLRAAQKAGVAADIRKAESELEQAVNAAKLASNDVKTVLAPLSALDAKAGVKMVELVPLKKRKNPNKTVPIYVKSTSLKESLADKRIYLLDGEKEKRAHEKVIKDGKIDAAALKKNIGEKVQDKAKFSKKWKLKREDGEEYGGVLSDWAKTMNASIHELIARDIQSPTEADRKLDLSAAAQLMRYTCGAGLEANFKPFLGNLNDKRDTSWPQRVIRGAKSGELGIKANAHASFAIGEARATTAVFLPNYAGWHATTQLGGQTLELGYWRCELELILSGSVGVSLAIEGELEVSYTGGKQGLRGIPAEDKGKPGAKARVGAAAELDVFAGARAGIQPKGAIQWLNPEGAISNGKPLKTKANDAIAEFKDIAKIDASISGSAGMGISGGFKIKHEGGKFVIYAKLGACLGIGGQATLKFEADTETIGEFFKCIAYQLKRADYHKIVDAIDTPAYRIFCMVHYLVIVKGVDLGIAAFNTAEETERDFNKAVAGVDDAIKRGGQAAEDFIFRIRNEFLKQTGSWLGYAPPEVAGRIQLHIASLGFSDAPDLRPKAPELMALALGAPQTMNQLQTVAERMTSSMGQKQDLAAGMRIIENCLRDSGQASALAAAESRLVKAQPILSTPFIWNTEPDFISATAGIEHPMYA